MNWNLSILKREDWDFRKCSDDDLWACHRYEYQRENEGLIKAVAEYRKQNPNFPDKYLETLLPLDPERFRTIGALGIKRPPPPPSEAALPPEWPDQSFFSPAGKPKVSSPRTSGKNRGLLRLEEIYLEEIVKYWNDNDSSFGHGGRIWNAKYASETAAFKIYWRYTDIDLIGGFADWLKENRPHGEESDYRPKVEVLKKLTGAAAPNRQLRPQLKALGAYRLLLCYKGNRQKAKAHSADICNVLGKNFAHDSAWTEARNLTKKTMKKSPLF